MLSLVGLLLATPLPTEWLDPEPLTPAALPASLDVEKVLTGDPTRSLLPGAIYLSEGELSALVGPADYASSVTVCSGVTDFSVLDRTGYGGGSDIFTIRNGAVEWWQWDDASSALVPLPVLGGWADAARVAVGAPNSGGFSMLAVTDPEQQALHLVWLLQDVPFFFAEPVALDDEVLDLVVVDLDGDQGHEAAVQTRSGITVFEFPGVALFHEPWDASEARLVLVREEERDALCSISSVEPDGPGEARIFDEHGWRGQKIDVLPQVRSVSAGDTNADGFDDVVVSHGSGADLYLHVGEASSTEPLLDPVELPSSVGAGPALLAIDVDRDADADLLSFDGDEILRTYSDVSGFTPRPSITVTRFGSNLTIDVTSLGDVAGEDYLELTIWDPAAAPATTVNLCAPGADPCATGAWPVALGPLGGLPALSTPIVVVELRAVGSGLRYPAAIVEVSPNDTGGFGIVKSFVSRTLPYVPPSSGGPATPINP